MRGRFLGAATLAAALLLPGTACSGPGSSSPGAGALATDPPVSTSGAWSPLPESPLSPRHEVVGAWLEDRFVLVGGWSHQPCPPNASCVAPEDPALSDGASFNPETGEWGPIAAAPVPVSGWNSVVLGDALYILTGDPSRDDSPVVLLRYAPADDTWTTLPAPPGSGGELLAAGEALLSISPTDELAGSADWRFDEPAMRWTRLPDDPLGPSFDREAVWLDGTLILTAKDLVEQPGSEEPSLVRLARFDEDGWTVLPDSATIGGGPTAVSGLIVFPQTGSADGGEVNNWGRDVFFGGIYDPADGSWEDLPSPPPGGLTGLTLTLDDRTLVGGHLLEPRSGSWTKLPGLPGVERSAGAAVAGPDSILVWGGSTSTDNLGDGYLLQLPPAP